MARRALLHRMGLSAFLNHVVRTVPYYRHLQVDGTAPALAAFPVVDRDLVAGDPLAFRSGTFAADARLLAAETNGTVRRKLRVIFDLVAWFDLNYGTYETVERQLPGLAERLKPGAASVVMVVDNPAARPMVQVVPTLADSLLRQVVLGASPDADRCLVRDLVSAPPDLLYGKPSNLLELVRIAHGSGIGEMRPFAVLTSGENLYDDDRDRLAQLFRAPVRNAYIATEGGLIGIDCAHRTGLHLQEDRVLVELVDGSGTAVREGLGEVLVTGFTNWAQAFVRYKVGDIADVVAFRCPCGHEGRTIVRLWGGEVREYPTAQGHVATDVLNRSILGAGVSRFQVRRLGADHFRVVWVPESDDPSRLVAVQRQLASALSERLSAAAVELVPVRRIVARGGKARRFPAGGGRSRP